MTKPNKERKHEPGNYGYCAKCGNSLYGLPEDAECHPPTQEEHDSQMCEENIFRGINVCDGTIRGDGGFEVRCPCVCHSSKNHENFFDKFKDNPEFQRLLKEEREKLDKELAPTPDLREKIRDICRKYIWKLEYGEETKYGVDEFPLNQMYDSLLALIQAEREEAVKEERDGEVKIHSYVSDCLPVSHKLAWQQVECKICGVLVHAGNNECMQTWYETDNGNFCTRHFSPIEVMEIGLTPQPKED